jgi:hypothetical protein
MTFNENRQYVYKHRCQDLRSYKFIHIWDWWFHNGHSLGSDNMSFGKSQPTFRSNIPPPSSRRKYKPSPVNSLAIYSHTGFLSDLFFDPEDRDDMFLRNVRWLSTNWIDSTFLTTGVRTSNPINVFLLRTDNLTEVIIDNTISWVVTPYGSVRVHRRFGVTYRLHLSSQ